MSSNPFRPPAADVAGQSVEIERPASVALLTLFIAAFTVAAGVRAVAYGSLPQAAVALFLCAFVSFVPAGLWLGRPWAPPVGVLLGILVAVLAFGSVLVQGGALSDAALAFRLGSGVFAIVLVAALLVLRRHRYFGVIVVQEPR